MTSLEFQLHPIGPTLLAGSVAHPFSAARETLRFYRDFAAAAPEELIVYASLGHGPDGTRRVGMRAVFNGPVEDGERVLRDLRRFGQPIADEIHPRSYSEIQQLIDPNFPAGRLNYWKAHFLDELSDDLIDHAIDVFSRAPSRYSGIAFEQMGGAVARQGPSDTAFDHRSAAYSLLILAGWEDAAETEANVSWARDLWEDLRPLASAGVYVNYLGGEGDDRVREAYGANLDRLVEIKTKYDPGNFFRMNQNIRPVARRLASANIRGACCSAPRCVVTTTVPRSSVPKAEVRS